MPERPTPGRWNERIGTAGVLYRRFVNGIAGTLAACNAFKLEGFAAARWAARSLPYEGVET